MWLPADAAGRPVCAFVSRALKRVRSRKENCPARTETSALILPCSLHCILR